MRLTLRTLLAYMDDILDPDDQDALTRKVESSDFASDLIHRTRDTMRRLRLGAPRVMGAGIGLDPNTVAEYLDNTLSADSIADFERVCLESDIHLAEAASCHHILTMILGEPADIDPELRTRMYAIAQTDPQRRMHRLEGAHGVAQESAGHQEAAERAGSEPVSDGNQAAASATTVDPAIRSKSRRGREIPDYLRAADRSWVRRLGAVAAALLIIAVAGVMALSLVGWAPQPLAWLRPAEPAPAPAGAAESDDAQTDPDQPQLLEPSPPSGPSDADAPAGAGIPTPEAIEPSNATASTGDPSDILPADTVDTGVPLDNGPLLDGPPTESTIPPAESPLAAQPLAVEPSSADSLLPPTSTPLVPDGLGNDPTNVVPRTPSIDVTSIDDTTPEFRLPAAGDQSPTAGATTGTEPGDETAVVGETSTVPAGLPDEPPRIDPEVLADADVDKVPTAEQPPSELGMYWDDRDLLLRYDPEPGSWVRLASRTPVENGNQLLSLPTFRPNISLHSGMGLNLSGATLVVLGISPTSEVDPADSIPTIELVYGRIVAVNTSGQESSVRLVMGDVEATAQLARNAMLAVEVVRSHVAGRDPLQQPAPLRAMVYAPQGGVVWTAADQTTTISAPSQWLVVGRGEVDVAPLDDEVDWLKGEPTQRLEERGAAEVRDQLQPGNLAGTALLELFYGTRRREVKSMAARCSVYVGEFGPFVDALGDSDQRAAWGTHIDTLHSAMALNSASAERIYEALVRQRGEEAAADLFEMICGYDHDAVGRNPEEARQRGALEKLIDRLESDSLDYRVLAAHNLREITGKNLMPNPAGNPAERLQGVRRWRQRLKDGELSAVADDS